MAQTKRSKIVGDSNCRARARSSNDKTDQPGNSNCRGEGCVVVALQLVDVSTTPRTLILDRESRASTEARPLQRIPPVLPNRLIGDFVTDVGECPLGCGRKLRSDSLRRTEV